MRRILQLNSLLTFSLALNWFSYLQESDTKGLLNNTAQGFVKFIKSGALDSASTLFHYPSTYSPDDLSNDMRSVTGHLKLLSDEFGKIIKADRSDNPTLFRYVSVGGGDISYWQKYNLTFPVTYKVQFEKEGQGYLTFNFCSIDGKWRLRDVQFGLPESRPDSQKRIAEITLKLLMQMKKIEDK